jgi:Bacterial TniB protein
MMDADHLEPATRDVLKLAPEQRIDYILRPRWIGYPKAKLILQRLEEILRHPKTHRMPNLLIVSETNNGKTSLAARFVERYRNPDPKGNRIRVLTVQAPPIPDENRFYGAILESLHAPYRPHETAARREIQVKHLLRSIGLEMLIIDEIQHIVAGHNNKQRHFLNVLKCLSNDLQIPLVGMGTVEALRAIQTDRQVTSRFEPVAIPKWEWQTEYRMLLASFERMLPLPAPSSLAADGLGRKLLALSEGTIGELATLINRAAIMAIRKGRDRIDERVLADTDWTPPSERRRQVEGLL